MLACFVALLTCAPAFADAAGGENEPYTIPLVMVVVGFDGGDDPAAAVPYDDAYDWGYALFGADESPATYYLGMSEGAFTFVPAHETSASGASGNANAADSADDGIVHVTLHRPHGAWGAVNVDSSVTRDFALVVMEALSEAGNYIDFASYDSNGDGNLAHDELAICICVAGYEGASVSDYRRTDIPLMWSHAGYLSVIGGERELDGLTFDTYIAISERYWDEVGPIENAEREPLGTVYHELGHVLGLPDLYAVDTTEGPWEGFGVGALSLMDQGGWQYADDGSGYRNIPTSLDAWSRYALGWAEPTIVAKSGDYAVSSQLSDAGYSQLVIPTSDPDEYFLVENRLVEGPDIGLSEDYGGPVGVIVWHVDNGMYERYYDANQVNDADHRPFVTPENEAGETELELLLYSDADDVPDARTAAGITVSYSADTARDAVVHIELDDAAAAANALHLLHDSARDDLSQSGQELLPQLTTIIQAASSAKQ